MHSVLISSLPARDIQVLTWTNPRPRRVKRISARYTRPYQMHGSIGPSCALALSTDDGVTVWTHTQGVFPLRGALAELLGLPPEKVRCIHVEGSGCYGHNGADDVAADAALIARAVPGRPIRVQWMREQEHIAEPFGPAMVAEVSGALDAEGADRRLGLRRLEQHAQPAAQRGRPADPERRAAGSAAGAAARADPDAGGRRRPQQQPDLCVSERRVVYHFVPDMPLRVSAMRSLGAYLNIFAIESFMDELADAARRRSG